MNHTQHNMSKEPLKFSRLSLLVRNVFAGIAIVCCSFTALADEKIDTFDDSESPRYLSSALDIVTANHVSPVAQTDDDPLVTDVSVTNIAADDSRVW